MFLYIFLYDIVYIFKWLVKFWFVFWNIIICRYGINIIFKDKVNMIKYY